MELRQAASRQTPLARHLSARHRHRGREQGGPHHAHTHTHTHHHLSYLKGAIAIISNYVAHLNCTATVPRHVLFSRRVSGKLMSFDLCRSDSIKRRFVWF